MTQSDDHLDDAALEALFATARAEVPQPSVALMERLRMDALSAQPRPLAAPAPRRSLVAQVLEAIGGWPALAGLATAGVAGLWIGMNPPQPLLALVGPGDLSYLAPYDLSLLDEEN